VRLSFTQPDDILRRGLSILAEEVVKAYREAGITF
jgi:alanine-alpha-ketoisovalerate/valine-pyruvate aminotransferase